MTENKNSGCSQRDSAEYEGYAKASRSFKRIWKEKDSAQPKLLERVLLIDEKRDEKYTNQYTVTTLFPDENPVDALKRELLTLISLKEAAEFPSLSDKGKNILDIVIEKLGKMSKNEIVSFMHKEQAYIETAPWDVIQFKYAESLQI